MNFFYVLLIASNFCCSLIFGAASVEDRMLDIEAQISSIKSDLAATQSLAAQERPSAFNPMISVIGDFVGQYGFGVKAKSDDHHHDDHGGHGHHHHHKFRNGVLARELSFEFRGAVDPFADVLVELAIVPHSFDEIDIHLEEAYARFKLFGSTLKFGRFRTSIGRMGRIHLHNIPQITYPIAMRTFLGDEGYQAQGLSFNTAWNLSSKTALNIFLEGVFLNKLPMQKDGAEKMPQGIGHLWWHQELAPFHYLDIGTSVVFGRKGKKNSGLFFLAGGDVHYSYVPAGYGQNPIFLFGSEFYSANVTSGRWPIGGFTWAQVRVIGSSFFGARYDLAPQDEDLKKFQHALNGYITHYTTEFLRFRLGYEHVMPNISSFDGDHRLIASVIWILGSHPMEPYFVNR